MLPARRTAGAVVHLLGTITLKQKQPAGFDGGHHPGKHTIVGLRWQKLDEHRHQRVVAVGYPRPRVNVTQLVSDVNVAALRQALGLGQGVGCKIECADLEALFSQPDAVPAFAIGYAERRATSP